jgi:hypothetical protein
MAKPESGGGGSTGRHSGPAPSGPATPGPGPAATPAAVTHRGGAPIDFRRGRYSKERLRIDWSYPVWKGPAVTAAPGTTVAQMSEHALPLAEAMEFVVAGDPRPLLVLRECEFCKGTEHALLSRTLDNEQTALLSHWFHCVRLPTNVLRPDHPLSQLFAHKDGERVPHLYFCDLDGGNKVGLPGDQAQAELWKVMFSFLERTYQGDAKKAVSELRGMLSQFDKLDAAEDQLKARIDRAAERHGPDADQLAQDEHDLKRVAKDRQRLIDHEKAVRALALKTLIDSRIDGKVASKDAASPADR